MPIVNLGLGEAAAPAAEVAPVDADAAGAPAPVVDPAVPVDVNAGKPAGEEESLLARLKRMVNDCKTASDYRLLLGGKQGDGTLPAMRSEFVAACQMDDANLVQEFWFLAKARRGLLVMGQCADSAIKLSEQQLSWVGAVYEFFLNNKKDGAYFNMATPNTKIEHDVAYVEFDRLYKEMCAKGLLAALPAPSAVAGSADPVRVVYPEDVRLENAAAGASESPRSAEAAGLSRGPSSEAASDSDEEKLSAEEAARRATHPDVLSIQDEIKHLNDDIGAIQLEISELKIPEAGSETVASFMSRRVRSLLVKVESCVSIADNISSSILSTYANGLFENNRTLISGIDGLLTLGTTNTRLEDGIIQSYVSREIGDIAQMENICSECIEHLREKLLPLYDAAEMLDRTQVNRETKTTEVVEYGINSKIAAQLAELHTSIILMREKVDGMKQFVAAETMRDMSSVNVAATFREKFGVSLVDKSVRSLRWKGYMQQVRKFSDIFATRLEALCGEAANDDRRQRGLLALEEKTTTTGCGCFRKTHIDYVPSEANLGGLMSAVITHLKNMRTSYEKTSTVSPNDVEQLKNRCLEFTDGITLERILGVEVVAGQDPIEQCIARLNYIFSAETFTTTAAHIRKDVPNEKNLQVYMHGGETYGTRILEGNVNGKVTRDEVAVTEQYEGLVQVASLESALYCFGAISEWSQSAMRWSGIANKAAGDAMKAKKDEAAPALSKMLDTQANSLLERVNEIAGYGALHGIFSIGNMRQTLATFTDVLQSDAVVVFLRKCEADAENFALREVVAMGVNKGQNALEVEVLAEATKRFEQEVSDGADVSIRETRIPQLMSSLKGNDVFMRKLTQERKDRFFGKVFQDNRDNLCLTPEIRKSIRKLFHNVTVGLRFAQRLSRMQEMVGRGCNFGTITAYYRGITSLIEQYQNQGQIIASALFALQQSNGINLQSVSTFESALDVELKIIQGQEGAPGLKQQLEGFATALRTWLGGESEAAVKVIQDVSAALENEEKAVGEAIGKVATYLEGRGEVQQIGNCVLERDSLRNDGNVVEAMEQRATAIDTFNASFVLNADFVATGDGAGAAVLRDDEEEESPKP